MPARSTIDQLPEAVREWLEAELVRRGFADYRGLVDDLNAELQRRGVEANVSRSSLHRYGQDVEERIAALRRSTEIARTIVKEVGDDEGAMNDALTRLIQDRLFSFVTDAGIQLDTKQLTALGHCIADVGRGSVIQKKWMQAVRAKADAVAAEVAAKARESGLTEDTIDLFKRKILGIGTA